MEQLTYLALLVGCLVVTAPLELVLRVRVYARWRRLLLAVVPEFVVFVVWVLYAIAEGHWDYSSTRTIDVRLPGGIPVEEVLFFLVVPVCAVLALEAVSRPRRLAVFARRLTAAQLARVRVTMAKPKSRSSTGA